MSFLSQLQLEPLEWVFVCRLWYSLSTSESLGRTSALVLWPGEQYNLTQALKLYGHSNFPFTIQIKVVLRRSTDYVETDGTFPEQFLVKQFSSSCSILEIPSSNT